MKIVKYKQFILENMEEEVAPESTGGGVSNTDTAETYSNTLLSKLKRKVELMFDEEQIKKMSDNDKSKPTFAEYNITLDDIELSTQPSDRLSFTFSDDGFYYKVYIEVKIKDVAKDISEVEDGGDFNIKDIKKCYLKFKKYDKNNDEVVGQVDKNLKVNDFDEEYLINLKIEIDDDFGDDDGFEIETK